MLYVARYVLPVGPDTYIPGDILQGPLDWPNLQYLISLRRIMPVHDAHEAMQAMLGVGVSEELATARVSEFFDTPAPAPAEPKTLPKAYSIPAPLPADMLPADKTSILDAFRPSKRKEKAAAKPPAKRRGRPRTKA